MQHRDAAGRPEGERENAHWKFRVDSDINKDKTRPAISSSSHLFLMFSSRSREEKAGLPGFI